MRAAPPRPPLAGEARTIPPNRLNVVRMPSPSHTPTANCIAPGSLQRPIAGEGCATDAAAPSLPHDTPLRASATPVRAGHRTGRAGPGENFSACGRLPEGHKRRWAVSRPAMISPSKPEKPQLPAGNWFETTQS
ncbi:MAG: hypothetical protein QGG53_17470, partial [Planctomycetota bacterium]|nr:hypothetical protein [Planctomycetota bacterium]